MSRLRSTAAKHAERIVLGHNGSIQALRGTPGQWPLSDTPWGRELLEHETLRKRLSESAAPVPWEVEA